MQYIYTISACIEYNERKMRNWYSSILSLSLFVWLVGYSYWFYVSVIVDVGEHVVVRHSTAHTYIGAVQYNTIS